MSEPAPMAIVYDFDGTLAPGRMQDRQFIPATIGGDVEKFWDAVNENTAEHNADPILSYMYVMLKKCREAGAEVHRDDLAEKSGDIRFFPGIEEWFGRMNTHAASLGVRLEHFVISSGNAEIIESTTIAHEFQRIYASRFLYDEQGMAAWPAVAINFTTKTQYLFRINKGALDHQDIPMINQYIPRNERAVPFENMVYVGDGETDVPCFQLITNLGGLSVAVHEEGKRASAQQYLEDGRVDAVAAADYQPGSHLERIVRAQVTLVASRNRVRQNIAAPMSVRTGAKAGAAPASPQAGEPGRGMRRAALHEK